MVSPFNVIAYAVSCTGDCEHTSTIVVVSLPMLVQYEDTKVIAFDSLFMHSIASAMDSHVQLIYGCVIVYPHRVCALQFAVKFVEKNAFESEFVLLSMHGTIVSLV